MTSDFGQRVMAAAGVQPYFGSCVECGHGKSEHLQSRAAPAPAEDFCTVPYCSCECYQYPIPAYPDPLTPEGFCALWDAMKTLGWRVEFRTLSDGTLSQVYKADEMGRPDLASIFQGGHENPAAALLEAAAQALGVPR